MGEAAQYGTKNHCNEASGRLGSAGSHCYGAQARDDKLKLCDQIVKLMIDIDGYMMAT